MKIEKLTEGLAGLLAIWTEGSDDDWYLTIRAARGGPDLAGAIWTPATDGYDIHSDGCGIAGRGGAWAKALADMDRRGQWPNLEDATDG